MDLKKAYDRVNRDAIWQVLRMYDVGVKLLNGIKSMYVKSLAYVRVKRNECFRINSNGRQGCIKSPWLFNVYMDVVTKEKMGMRRKGRGWRLPSLLYADELVCVVSWRKT